MMTSPQILELDFRVQQLVRADDHVHRAGFQPLDGLVDLFGGLESLMAATLTGKPSNRSLNVS